MLRRALFTVLLVAGACAHSKPAEVPVTVPTALLAPRDEPNQLLLGFESTDELRIVHELDAKMALGPDGATQGAQALKLTAVAGNTPFPGLRVTFAPAASWVGMHELAVDVTNPEDVEQHLSIIVSTKPEIDKEHRKRGGRTIPPHTTATVRLALGSEWGPFQPLANRTGLIAKETGTDIDLSKIHWVFFMLDHSKLGQSIILDNIRLVKRDDHGVAISPAPPVKRPKVAVTDVRDLTGEFGSKAALLTSVVYDEVSAAKTADVIGSADIAEMLGAERQKQLLGCSEGSCLADIGGALGSDFLVTGQVGKLGSRVRIEVRVVDVRHNKVLASAGDFVAAGNDDALADATTRLTRQALHGSPIGPK